MGNTDVDRDESWTEKTCRRKIPPRVWQFDKLTTDVTSRGRLTNITMSNTHQMTLYIGEINLMQAEFMKAEKKRRHCSGTEQDKQLCCTSWVATSPS